MIDYNELERLQKSPLREIEDMMLDADHNWRGSEEEQGDRIEMLMYARRCQLDMIFQYDEDNAQRLKLFNERLRYAEEHSYHGCTN